MKILIMISILLLTNASYAQYTPQGDRDMENAGYYSVEENTSSIHLQFAKFRCDPLNRRILLSIPEIITKHPKQANFYAFNTWTRFSSCTEALKAAQNYTYGGNLLGQIITKTRLFKETKCVGGNWGGTCYETGRVFQNTDYILNFYPLGKMILENQINEFHSGSTTIPSDPPSGNPTCPRGCCSTWC
jgi:hypothetical protein